jgi:hypothetical protein
MDGPYSDSQSTSQGRTGVTHERKREKRSEGYVDVARTAVHKEGDVKKDMGPSVSMTMVADKMEVHQHFNF